MPRSKFLTVNSRDLIHGAIVAAISGGMVSLSAVVQSGGMPTVDQLKMALVAAVAGGLGYVVKKYAQNDRGGFGPEEDQP
jgi:hypothetical protein